MCFSVFLFKSDYQIRIKYSNLNLTFVNSLTQIGWLIYAELSQNPSGSMW